MHKYYSEVACNNYIYVLSPPPPPHPLCPPHPLSLSPPLPLPPSPSLSPLTPSPSLSPRQSACSWALGQIGRHTPEHAKAVAQANVLPKLLEIYLNQKASEDLQTKVQLYMYVHLPSFSYAPVIILDDCVQ